MVITGGAVCPAPYNVLEYKNTGVLTLPESEFI